MTPKLIHHELVTAAFIVNAVLLYAEAHIIVVIGFGLFTNLLWLWEPEYIAAAIGRLRKKETRDVEVGN